MATVATLLDGATRELADSGATSPRLDAELLLGHVLGVERTGVIAHPGAPVSTGQEASFRSLLARRASGIPVACTGSSEAGSRWTKYPPPAYNLPHR